MTIAPLLDSSRKIIQGVCRSYCVPTMVVTKRLGAKSAKGKGEVASNLLPSFRNLKSGRGPLPERYRLHRLWAPLLLYSIRDRVWPAARREDLKGLTGEVYFVPEERTGEFERATV